MKQKKIILPIILLLFTLTTVWSQDKEKTVTLPEVKVTSSASVSENLTNSFKKSFPDAYNLRWYKYDRNYLAKFIQEDMDHNALFKKNGYLVYDISYGFEKNLPENIHDMVTGVYDNFKIIRSINVKTEGRDIWIVQLEGLKKYATVRIEDMEIDEVERFNKADVD